MALGDLASPKAKLECLFGPPGRREMGGGVAAF